jgi:hypothetical protein
MLIILYVVVAFITSLLIAYQNGRYWNIKDATFLSFIICGMLWPFLLLFYFMNVLKTLEKVIKINLTKTNLGL